LFAFNSDAVLAAARDPPAEGVMYHRAEICRQTRCDSPSLHQRVNGPHCFNFIRGGTMKRLILTIASLGMITAFISMVPDIRRYLKIRSM
jgi:hypothetical protein